MEAFFYNLGANVSLQATEEVGNAVLNDSQRDYYNCPCCGSQVYVIKGLPYRGDC